ncbi:AAA family ATPase [Acetatifactor aquisgranensis]|uniref:AAA family ATPase n=1 Tax=Acetatifactor aquisgranensis TaxID=2941233 RepID=UPI00203B05CE|nr:AAA family ATPase [Acetatifactor aquisgranensis]
MYVSSEVAELIEKAFSTAKAARFEYVTPEVALYAACQNPVFARAFENCGGNLRELDMDLRNYLEEYMEQGADSGQEPQLSQGMGDVMAHGWETSRNSDKPMMELPHLISAMYGLTESYAVYFLRKQGVERVDLLQEMTVAYEEISLEKKRGKNAAGRKAYQTAPAAPGGKGRQSVGPEDEETGFGKESGMEDEVGTDGEEDWGDEEDGEASAQDNFWQQYATCLNDGLEGTNPLIGRAEELERTMQILCRKEKNNPLHIGEPGVGKTAITYGLARLLNEGKVPAPLAGARIFALDLGSLLAGTQYRGDFEKRFKRVMDSIARQEKPIVYIDEIHNIVGAGAVNGGSFDISNMLKPYLARGHIRFIGATTYEEYKKHFEKNKSLVRRFRNIDIKEPETADAVRILEGLRENYESFHGVRYEVGVLEYAVEMSAKYINERYLPDKAIDLIDEAGAYRRIHPMGEESAGLPDKTPWEMQPVGQRGEGVSREGDIPVDSRAAEGNVQKVDSGAAPPQEDGCLPDDGASGRAGTIQTVNRKLIDEILSRTCQIPKQVVESDETAALATLEGRLKAKVFGQEEAISQVVNAVKFSRAGLLEEGKPLASLLFVGPTGVGKTEIAKSLAAELGIRLIRFDMSEYGEKHAVAKLIGAPAGYVGYEEGGLLTEEIRKNPHAVLLLDEIEKAHPDIYNILLQAMDYATLTDNQGRKADFRNVIIIMTSNAGASRIGKHGIGFQGQDVGSDVILEEVKRIFQPEFRNRLNRIVVFRGMDGKMAEQIVERKLGELAKMLLRKNVHFCADERAKKLTEKKGISAEFGAREIERVIQGEVKPLLVDEILFGALKDGGTCTLTEADGKFGLMLSPGKESGISGRER